MVDAVQPARSRWVHTRAALKAVVFYWFSRRQFSAVRSIKAMILIPDRTDSLQLPFTGTACSGNHQAAKQRVPRRIYNPPEVAIDSQNCATLADAVQWLSEHLETGGNDEITIDFEQDAASTKSRGFFI